MDTAAPDRPPAGIYVHVPFCLGKCPYCDFYSTAELPEADAFVGALEEELRLAPELSCPADSLYLGGGTPSVLSAAQLGRIFSAVGRRFRLSADLEASIEVNPATADRGKLEALRRMGFNRVSVGVQSFDDGRLRWLGRRHGAADALQTIEMARAAGFGRLGLDLIYGLPGQRVSDWLADLAQAVACEPEHLSCYMLTVEPGTPLAAEVACGRVTLAAEDTLAEMFTATVEFLGERGWRQYEISNFARQPAPGGGDNRSRHNRKYWNFAPYLGFGPAAHSYLAPRRWWNVADLGRYLRALGAGRLPREGGERLGAEQVFLEAVYLGLRQNEGIDLAAFRRRCGVDLGRLAAGLIDELAAAGLARVESGRLALTTAGLLVHEGICARLADACG